jgi:hypothetical protein
MKAYLTLLLIVLSSITCNKMKTETQDFGKGGKAIDTNGMTTTVVQNQSETKATVIDGGKDATPIVIPTVTPTVVPTLPTQNQNQNGIVSTGKSDSSIVIPSQNQNTIVSTDYIPIHRNRYVTSAYNYPNYNYYPQNRYVTSNRIPNYIPHLQQNYVSAGYSYPNYNNNYYPRYVNSGYNRPIYSTPIISKGSTVTGVYASQNQNQNIKGL